MKRRMKKLDNMGYTLIEMIIVIAIIAVLTGAATLTVNTINSARAKEAAITFESEVATVHGKAKGKACDSDCDGAISDTELKQDNYGLRVYEDDSRLYVQHVIVRNGVYVPVTAFEKANNAHNGKGTRLPANVYCEYVPLDASLASYRIGDGSGSDDSVIIFTRSGRCDGGAGTYNFYRTSGDQIAQVTINPNGSYTSK